jgi:NTE family protein
LTDVEAFACGVHPVSARRLVRIHDRRSGEVSGTTAWLARLPCFMHHHVALEDQVDINSLIRFLSGRAIGFVAAGGGSFGSAHAGIYKAFRERGVTFDIFVGTSVGWPGGCGGVTSPLPSGTIIATKGCISFLLLCWGYSHDIDGDSRRPR